MFTLGHIEPAIEVIKEFKYFCTITLPKCHYRKGPVKQAEAMDKMIKQIASNYFEEAYGTYEFTQKGNVHSHFIVRIREDLELSNNQATAKFMMAMLKQYSNCDFQVIKDMGNTLAYVYKDVPDSLKILGKDPRKSITKSKNAMTIKELQFTAEEHVMKHRAFRDPRCYYCEEEYKEFNTNRI